jgi:hypothetical protein
MNRDHLQTAMDEVFDRVPVERIRKERFRLTFIYFTLFFIIVFLTGTFEAAVDVPQESDPHMSPYATAWADEIAAADPGHPVRFAEEVALEPTELPILQPACPQGGLVPHPCREPDNLRIVRISRYDPQLGGTNCFRWDHVNNTCASNTADGSDWRLGFEQWAACAPEWPFGTIFEIGSHRWVCKDRGGKIVKINDVYWVDLLSKNLSQYGLAFGDVTTVSVWWP